MNDVILRFVIYIHCHAQNLNMINTLTKQLFLSTSLLFVAITTSFGQTAILQSTNLPIVGDNWISKTFYDTTAQAGPGGSGVMWDFSLYVVSVNTLTESFRAPLTSGIDASFVGANLKCNSYFGWTDYFFKNAAGTELQYLGFQNASNEVRISNTQRVLTIPFAYGASISNVPLTGTGFAGSTLTGTISVVADGEGTLKTGAFTYYNVLRVKYDFDMVEDFGGPVSPVHVVKYAWYKAGTRAPFMEMSTLNMSGIVGNSVQKYITVFYQATNGIDDLNKPELNFSVYPNPTSAQTTVQLNIDRASEVMIKIIDITGRIVSSEISQLHAGDNILKLDVSTLPKGVYILSAIAGSSIREKRIIVTE